MPLDLPLSVLLALTVLATGLIILSVQRRYARWMGGHRRSRGVRAEQTAGKILSRAGYKVKTERPRIRAHTCIDGKRHETTLYGDLVAVKQRQTYLVEVKSGQLASATREATRRQLLEYWLNTDYDGLLLVDTRSGTIQTVDFEYPNARST